MSDNQEEQSTSNADKSGEEVEDVVLELGQIIQQEEEMMEEVAAVLGAGDDFNCSYGQGYLKRQALYACLTCLPESKADYTKSAGFCLACSYYCHEGHELVELYTKRNFRCDCGNGRFGAFICNLQANKDTYNITNKYNQNFSGLYCTCAKPYPDPEDPIEDEMIQCIICEDWYHSRHLDSAVPKDFAEMICSSCIKHNEFLSYYACFSITSVSGEKNEKVNVEVGDNKGTETSKESDDKVILTEVEKMEVDSIEESKVETEKSNEIEIKETGCIENAEMAEVKENETKDNETAETNNETAETNKETAEMNNETTETSNETAETKDNETAETKENDTTETKINETAETKTNETKENETKNNDTKNNETKENETKENETKENETKAECKTSCKKPMKILGNPSTIFMKDLSWRSELCQCDECLKLYKDNKVEFLLDLEDTVEYYENKGKQKWNEIKTKAQVEEEKMLKALPRVPALEMIAGINDFKQQLVTYLRSFAEEKKVLTVADVQEFFATLKENYHKKRKTEHTYSCR